MQIFHRSTNTLARASLFGAAVLLGGATWVFARLDGSPYATRQGVVREQPVPFSHEHHVRGLGIDCRFCHASVETSAFAGMPSTATCMQCHGELWTDAEPLAPVRASWRTGQPIAWTRVHDLPDFAYFDHAIHVAKGVSCTTCHGPVEEMPLMRSAASLRMEWCLDCHRDPIGRLRPPDEVFATGAAPVPDEASQRALAAALDVRPRTSCSTCHR